MANKKYIESPAKMWELFQQYRQHCKDNPIRVHDFVGKDGEEVWRERERPLTTEGFENHCFEKGIINDLGDYFSNKNGSYSDFSTICRTIRRIIREDQIAGGMAGIYNPSITQRLNGLTEKVEESGNKELTIKVKYERKGGDTGSTTSGTAEDSE